MKKGLIFMPTNTTQKVAQPFTVNRNIMTATGTGFSVDARVATQLQAAHKILSNKKSTDAERTQAQAVMNQIHLADTNAYYLEQCVSMGVKSGTEPAYVFSTLRNVNGVPQIPTLTEYYKLLPDYLRALFNAKARTRINDLYGYNFDEKILTELESTGALFTYEYLCSGVAYCVSKRTDKEGNQVVSRYLLTRNLALVAQLKQYGCVSVTDSTQKAGWLDTMESNLHGTTAAKYLREHKCTVLCLRPAKTENKRAVYDVTKRMSALSLDGEADTTLYPLEVCSVLGTYLNSSDTAGSLVYELRTAQDDGGTHKMCVTASVTTALACYPDTEEETQTMCDVMNAAGLRGFNAGNLRIGMYRVDKDELTLGAFYPETLCGIARTQDACVHNAENRRDTVAARMIFNTRVSALKKEQFDVFNAFVPGVADLTLKKDKKSAVLSWGAQQSDEDLYAFMEKPPFVGTLYPDLRDACVRRRKVMPVYLKNFIPVQIPKQGTPDAIASVYRNAMANGVLKVAYMTKTGVIKTLRLTNNMHVLLNTYGKHYVAEWETTSVRLSAAFNDIKYQSSNPAITVNVYGVLEYYDLIGVLFPEGIPDEALGKDGKTLRTNVVLKMLQDAIEGLKTKNSSTVLAVTSIRGRVADASSLEVTRDGVSVYRTLKVASIIRAEYAPVNVK